VILKIVFINIVYFGYTIFLMEVIFMLSGFVGGLITAWILTIFDIDDILIGFFKETFKKSISINTYYVAFGILGMIAGLFGKGLL
jgi:ABC-type uncharacterized transport system permease subunit